MRFGTATGPPAPGLACSLIWALTAIQFVHERQRPMMSRAQTQTPKCAVKTRAVPCSRLQRVAASHVPTPAAAQPAIQQVPAACPEMFTAAVDPQETRDGASPTQT